MGYLNSSPLEAFTLAMIIQITFNIPRNMMMGIPTIIKHKGMVRTIYNSIDNWKFSDDFPF